MNAFLWMCAFVGAYVIHVWSYNHGFNDGYAKGRGRTFQEADAKAKEAESK